MFYMQLASVATDRIVLDACLILCLSRFHHDLGLQKLSHYYLLLKCFAVSEGSEDVQVLSSFSAIRLFCLETGLLLVSSTLLGPTLILKGEMKRNAMQIGVHWSLAMEECIEFMFVL
jgi:hypothetical protein